MRTFSPINTTALKATTGAAYEAVGGVKLASDILGVSVSQLSKYASPDKEWADRFIRVDLAVRLDRYSPHPFILTTMARELGYKPVPDDAQRAPGADICAMGVLRLDGILDDVVRELTAALADGKVCAAERHAIRKKIAAAKIALAKVEAAMIGGEP